MLHVPLFVVSLLALTATGSAAPCHVGSIDEPPGFVRAPVLQGDVLVVPRNEGGSSPDQQNTVTIYRRIAREWAVETVLDAVEGEGASIFGISVALDGDVLAIGDMNLTLPGHYSGVVFVHRYDGVGWPLEATLAVPADEPPSSSSKVGRSVAVEDDVVLVGAISHDVEGSSSAGAAFVFRNSADGWQLEAMLSHPMPSASDAFGGSVALRADVALIGAPAVDGPSNNTGRAYVFRYDGAEWALEQELVPPDHAKLFGWSVAFDGAGNSAVIGAPNTYQQDGAAYVYAYDGDGWVLQQELVAEEPVGLAPWFGTRVPIDAAAAVIIPAANGDSGAGFEGGAMHVFRHDGEQWIEEAKVTSPVPSPGAGFCGTSIWEDEAVARQSGSQGQVFLYAGLQGRDCLGTGQPDACDIFDGLAEDSTGSGIPDQCEFAGDLNGDGVVDVDDLLILLSLWGDCEVDPNMDPDSPAGCFGDISHDGQIGIDDLLILLANWG